MFSVMIRIPLLVLLTLFTTIAFGQQPGYVCGTSPADAAQIKERLLRNKVQLEEGLVFPRDIIYVPIKFHLVADNDGQGRISENEVLEQLCSLEADFAGTNIQFFIKDGFNYINNTSVYERHYQTINSIMLIQRDRRALNVFLVDDASPSPTSDGVAGYYSVNRDWIVLDKREAQGATSALAHEIGHFFSLLHTHYGWDEEPWSADIHGNPAPELSPGGIPTEKMDGSNCENAGDYICDTPPDYNGQNWFDCDYQSGAMDPAGVVIDPDETNFMGYFRRCARRSYQFSERQKAIMMADLTNASNYNGLNTPSRSYLLDQSPSTTASIEEASQLIYPIDNEKAAGGGTVNLQWEAVEGAEQYLIEIDRSPALVVSPIRLVSSTPTVEVSGLEIDRRYFWRVKPFNAISPCAPWTNIESFTVSLTTSTNTIPSVSGWRVLPNPVSRGRELILEFNAGDSFEADLVLFNLAGQRVQAIGRRRFSPGNNELSFPTSTLSPGVYLLSMVSEKGRLTQRVVIMD